MPVLFATRTDVTLEAERLVRDPAQFKWYAVTLLAIVFVIINTNQVEINFLFFKVTAPLLVALIVSMLLGFIVGLIFPKLRADKSGSQA